MREEEVSGVPFPEVIETERLTLRKPQVEDAPVIYASYGHDPEVAKFLLFRADQSLEQVEDFLRKAIRAWDAGRTATWSILLRGGGSLIGMIDLRMEEEANLGYVLARCYWSQGYMTEAVRAVVHWALQEMHLHRVWAICEIHNGASVRVLEKAGFTREAVLTDWMVFPNLGDRPQTCYRYGITLEEARR
jgi:ribosomal-protein-alanine N-acetyltransferase